jgi:hypothetical protein
MADGPQDSPRYRKEQAKKRAENISSSFGSGFDAATKTWFFYDRKKGRYTPVSGLVGIALSACIYGFAYDVVKDNFFPDPGQDAELTSSLTMTDNQFGYQSLVVEPGDSPIILVKEEDGSYQLYRETQSDQGVREITLIASRAEVVALMKEVSEKLTEPGEDTGFQPYEFRYNTISNEYKDVGDVQRFVERTNGLESAPQNISEIRAEELSGLWESIATQVQNGDAAYGFTTETAKNLEEQSEFNKNFTEG